MLSGNGFKCTTVKTGKIDNPEKKRQETVKEQREESERDDQWYMLQ